MYNFFNSDITLIESLAYITTGALCFYLACIHSILSETKRDKELMYQIKRLNDVEKDTSNEKWTKPHVIKAFEENISALKYWGILTGLFNLFIALLGLALLGFGFLSLVF